MPDFHLPPSDGYLIALSGGADSRLLLELTVRAALLRRSRRPTEEGHGDNARAPAEGVTGEADETAALPTVMAAHLHHGIRGAEADRDEAFCRAVCASLGVPLVVGHADIPALAAASGRSPETEAREARYAFLARVMAEHRIPTLLTAHHADDQLETVLHHLLRGSGTRGMSGIPQARPLPCAEQAAAGPAGQEGTEGCSRPCDPALASSGPADPNGANSNNHYTATLFRPLLGWTRRDILAACAEFGLDYVTDSTNLVGDCTRNRLRLTVIPALEAIAGEGVPQRAVGRLAAAAREDDEALTAIARERYEAAMRASATDSYAPPPPGEMPVKTRGERPMQAIIGDSATPRPVEPTAFAGVPVGAVQAEPAAIAKRMIGLAYAAFCRQTGDFHRNVHRGSTVQNRGSTVAHFPGKPENIPTRPPNCPPSQPAEASAVPADRTLSAYHLEALLDLCLRGREGSVSDLLPMDVRAEVRGGRLTFRSPKRRVTGGAVVGVKSEQKSDTGVKSEPDTQSKTGAMTVPEAGALAAVPDGGIGHMSAGGASPRPVPCPLSEGMTVWMGSGIAMGTDAMASAVDEGVGFTVEVSRAEAPDLPIPGEDVWASAVFPADGLPWPLLLRSRRAGDVIYSHGMNKKIKKLLCDKHIAPNLREKLPLICLPDGTPLWVPGVAFRDGYPPPDAGEAVCITVRLAGRVG